MNFNSVFKKLPEQFQSDSFLQTIAKLLFDRKVMFSSVIYRNSGNSYIIKKNEKTPYFSKDWQCYSFLRCMANTLITTGLFILYYAIGAILRNEKDLFKSNFCCGDSNIEKMYQNFRENQKQAVLVMSKDMQHTDITKYFNEEIYHVINAQEVKEKHKDQQISLKEIISHLIVRQESLPILIECGPTVLNQYYQSIQSDFTKNLIDGAYIAIFQGKLEPAHIGNEFSFEHSLFEKQWQSQKIDVFQNNKTIGTLYFEVYHNKK